MIIIRNLAWDTTSFVRSFIRGVNLSLKWALTIAKLLTCVQVQWLYF